jgi:hypothetical protein
MAWALPGRAVLGIFGKRPDPGSVKTRLAAECGPEFAAQAHEAMMLDIIDTWGTSRILAPGGRRVVVFSPEEAGPWFDVRVPEACVLQAQVGEDLGSRMRSFFAGEFEDGAERVVLIGSDSPTLDPTIVISAFLCLENRDLVLGPATDGGYYLIGCKPPVPPLFDRVDWGTDQVLAQTIERLAETDRSVAILPPWYDVDTPEDWRMLRGHLAALSRAGMNPDLPRLEALIAHQR